MITSGGYLKSKYRISMYKFLAVKIGERRLMMFLRIVYLLLCLYFGIMTAKAVHITGGDNSTDLSRGEKCKCKQTTEENIEKLVKDVKFIREYLERSENRGKLTLRHLHEFSL